MRFNISFYESCPEGWENINKVNEDGEAWDVFQWGINRCFNICDSIYHFAKSCPEGCENVNKVNEHGEAWDVFQWGINRCLCVKQLMLLVLNSACTKTVTGRAWRDTYLESLSNEERSQIRTLLGGTVFRFGGEMKKESSEKLILPCTTAGREVMIQTDVVDIDIPLLLSKPDMKRLGLQINMENDTAKIFDKVTDFIDNLHILQPEISKL